MNSYRKAIEELISETGITINGNQSFDIQVHNENFYKRVLQIHPDPRIATAGCTPVPPKW